MSSRAARIRAVGGQAPLIALLPVDVRIVPTFHARRSRSTPASCRCYQNVRRLASWLARACFFECLSPRCTARRGRCSWSIPRTVIPLPRATFLQWALECSDVITSVRASAYNPARCRQSRRGQTEGVDRSTAAAAATLHLFLGMGSMISLVCWHSWHRWHARALKRTCGCLGAGVWVGGGGQRNTYPQ